MKFGNHSLSNVFSVWTRIMLVLSYVHFLRVEIPNGANVIAQFCWLNHYCQWIVGWIIIASEIAIVVRWEAGGRARCLERLPSSQWSAVVPSRSRTRRFCWVDGGGKGCIFRIAKCTNKSWKWLGRIKARAQGSSGITGRQQVPKYHAKNHGRRDGHALRPEAGVTSPAHPYTSMEKTLGWLLG